jgi:hypothetical protein
MPTRRAFSRLLVSCLGIILAVILAEVGLRVLPLAPAVRTVATYQRVPPSAMGRRRADGVPDIAYQVEPGFFEFAPNVDVVIRNEAHVGGSWRFRTNNLGLRRDADTAIEKEPGLFRVLVLGDSHTSGYVSNNETFCALLEVGLNGQLRAASRRFEVLNGGVDGYGPSNYLRWYETNGSQLRPDLVLVMFYVGNDLE